MISGNLPEECIACLQPTRVTSLRTSLNTKFKHLVPKIKEFSSADGRVKFSFGENAGLGIAFLDYRSNVCNFRCKTCSPEFSSSWLSQLFTEQKEWEPYYSSAFMEELRVGISQSQYDSEILELVREFPLEEIYFAGGEPFYSKMHRSVIDYLIDSGRSKEVCLVYSTNLSMSEDSLIEWVKKWRHFKRVFVQCSLDGVHSTGEYIRTGLKYEKFLNNYELLLNSASQGSLRIRIDATITSLFFTQLKEFSEFILAHGSEFTAKAMQYGNQKSKFLRCEFLPKRIRQQLVAEWSEYFHALPENQQILLKDFKSTIELMCELDQFHETEYPRILRQIDTHDRQFKFQKSFAHFLCIHPALSEWYKVVTSSKFVNI
jgi:hypothetical protein